MKISQGKIISHVWIPAFTGMTKMTIFMPFSEYKESQQQHS